MKETPAAQSNNLWQGQERAARARLRRLAALACERLPAEQLNLASFHIAAYLDVAEGSQNLTTSMRRELEVERALRKEGHVELSLADRKLLRQFGIRPS